MLRKDEAMTMTHGRILYHVRIKNADGTPQRWRVNGACKTWKTQPNRFQLPLKYGLKTGGYITEENNHELTQDFDLHCCGCLEELRYSDSIDMVDFQGIVYCEKCQKEKRS